MILALILYQILAPTILTYFGQSMILGGAEEFRVKEYIYDMEM